MSEICQEKVDCRVLEGFFAVNKQKKAGWKERKANSL
jgi:hypothetical protein